MSRPLKLKVTGTVLCSVFQLPDHGFIGQFAGAHRRRFFPKRVGWASVDLGIQTSKLDRFLMRCKLPFFPARATSFSDTLTRGTAARLEDEW